MRIELDKSSHRLRIPQRLSHYELKNPLNVVFHVTRRCNLECPFCSESEFIPELGLDKIKIIRDHLTGVK